MEQIKKEETNLEANVEDNANVSNNEEQSESTEAGEKSEKTLEDKLKELGISRKDYFALKGEKSHEEERENSHGSNRGESQNKEVSNSVELEELIFANAGITDEAAKEAARKLVRLGEAKNLTDATQDEFVQNKQNTASEEQTHRKATPRPSQRVPTTRRDSPEYWIEKDELPEDQNLKMEVIKKKRELRKNTNKFGSGNRTITIK